MGVVISRLSQLREWHITQAPEASATKARLLLGSPLVGGSANGAWLGANAANGFAGNLVDLQVNGARMFRVDSAGAVLAGSTVQAQNFFADSPSGGVYTYYRRNGTTQCLVGSASDALRFVIYSSDTGTYRMAMDSNGRFGMGSVGAPDALLHLSGTEIGKPVQRVDAPSGQTADVANWRVGSALCGRILPGRHWVLGAPATAPSDGDMMGGAVVMYLDETTNKLKFRVRYNGTIVWMNAELPLTA